MLHDFAVLWMFALLFTIAVRCLRWHYRQQSEIDNIKRIINNLYEQKNKAKEGKEAGKEGKDKDKK